MSGLNNSVQFVSGEVHGNLSESLAKRGLLDGDATDVFVVYSAHTNGLNTSLKDRSFNFDSTQRGRVEEGSFYKSGAGASHDQAAYAFDAVADVAETGLSGGGQANEGQFFVIPHSVEKGKRVWLVPAISVDFRKCTSADEVRAGEARLTKLYVDIHQAVGYVVQNNGGTANLVLAPLSDGEFAGKNKTAATSCLVEASEAFTAPKVTTTVSTYGEFDGAAQSAILNRHVTLSKSVSKPANAHIADPRRTLVSLAEKYVARASSKLCFWRRCSMHHKVFAQELLTALRDNNDANLRTLVEGKTGVNATGHCAVLIKEASLYLSTVTAAAGAGAGHAAGDESVMTAGAPSAADLASRKPGTPPSIDLLGCMGGFCYNFAPAEEIIDMLKGLKDIAESGDPLFQVTFGMSPINYYVAKPYADKITFFKALVKLQNEYQDTAYSPEERASADTLIKWHENHLAHLSAKDTSVDHVGPTI